MLRLTFTAAAIEDGRQDFPKTRRGNAACLRLMRYLRRHHTDVKIDITHV